MRREHAEEWVQEIRQACLALRQQLAEKRIGQGRQLHIKYVGQATAVFRLRRSGAVQQPGRELDAAGSARPQELAACGQRAGRTEGGGDSFGGGILPPARQSQ